jgi:hypothetical protein
MRTSITQIIAALALAAAPSLVNSPTARISLLGPCLGAGLLLALRWNRRADPVTPSIRERLKAQGQTLTSLADRLRDVMRQTEQAVLDINERFMNIAYRSRTQLTRTAETIRRSNAVLEKVTPASGGGSDPCEQESSGELLKIKDETAALTRDIHGVIAALQFEDIVRQQIALVITELQQLRKAQDELEQDLAPLDRQGSRST